jgi:hypothetical protein
VPEPRGGLTVGRILQASRRIHDATQRHFDEAIVVVLDEIRDITGLDAVCLTILEDTDGVTNERVTAVSAGDRASIARDVGEQWPWAEGGSQALLGTGLVHVPDFAESFPGHGFLREQGLRGFLSVPLLAATDDRVIATIMGLDSTSSPIPADALEFTRLLTDAAGQLVLRETLRTEAEAAARRSDASLLATLHEVRDAQDQVGNSIAVVLGWLRLLADSSAQSSGPPGGIQIAIRRLEEAQSSIAELLRRSAVVALASHAQDVVNASGVLRTVRPDDPASAAPDIWVRANATHLAAFLTESADALTGGEVVTADAWALLFSGPGLITTTSLLTLHASGGSVVSVDGAQAVQWTRAAAPVTA